MATWSSIPGKDGCPALPWSKDVSVLMLCLPFTARELGETHTLITSFSCKFPLGPCNLRKLYRIDSV